MSDLGYIDPHSDTFYIQWCGRFRGLTGMLLDPGANRTINERLAAEAIAAFDTAHRERVGL